MTTIRELGPLAIGVALFGVLIRPCSREATSSATGCFPLSS